MCLKRKVFLPLRNEASWIDGQWTHSPNFELSTPTHNARNCGSYLIIIKINDVRQSYTISSSQWWQRHEREAISPTKTSSYGGTVQRQIGEAHTTLEVDEIVEREHPLKTQKSFYKDAINFAEGSIPQSIIMALCIGCVCGVVAYLYYFVLDSLLEFIWKHLPTKFVIDKWPEKLYVLWIPLTSVTLSICCGLSIHYLGEPGDLAYTIKCVHEKGYMGTHHILPMVASR